MLQQHIDASHALRCPAKPFTELLFRQAVIRNTVVEHGIRVDEQRGSMVSGQIEKSQRKQQVRLNNLRARNRAAAVICCAVTYGIEPISPEDFLEWMKIVIEAANPWHQMGNPSEVRVRALEDRDV